MGEGLVIDSGSYEMRCVLEFASPKHHVPRGLARDVGMAEAGSSGQGCRG